MSLTTRVIYNTASQFIGKIIVTILSLIQVTILTRYLGTQGYGEFSTIFIILYFLSLLTNLGFSTVIVREIARRRFSLEEVVGNTLSLKFFVALFVVFISFLVIIFLPYSLIVKKGIAIGILILVIGCFDQALISVFKAKLVVWKSVLAGVIGKLISLLIIIWIVFRGFSILSIVWAVVLGSFNSFLIDFLFVQNYLKIYPKFNFKIWSFLLKESLPLGIVDIIGYIHFKADSLILSLLKPMSHLGIYSVAYRFVEFLIALPSMFVASVFPPISADIKNKALLIKRFQRSFDFLSIMALPTSSGLFFIAPYAVNFIGGEQFSGATAPLRILCVAIFFTSLSNIMSCIIVAIGRQKAMLRTVSFIVFLNIILNFLFIPKFSYYAAASITSLTEFLGTVWLTYLVYRFKKVFPKMSIFKKAIVSTTIMLFFLFIIFRFVVIFQWSFFTKINIFYKGLILLGVIFYGALIYFISLYVLGGIHKEDFLKAFKG